MNTEELLELHALIKSRDRGFIDLIAEHALDMFMFLIDHERWEADVLLDDDCWDSIHSAQFGTPTITQELWDRSVVLASFRNRILSAFRDAGYFKVTYDNSESVNAP